MCHLQIKKNKNVFNFEQIREIINWALECIQIEAFCYPCFGLVSAKDSGCHEDMDLNTLLLSQKTFRLYFEEIVDLIMIEPNLNFTLLKKIGLKQETRMFRATKNINTHKGLVFAFGIIFYVALYGCYYQKPFAQWSNLIKRLVKPLKKDFYYFNYQTSGERLFQLYGILGARGTALAGYHIIFFQGLPFLKKYQKEYPNLTSNIKCLLLLIFYLHTIDDTVLINKIGFLQSQKIKKQAQVWLKLLDQKGLDFFYKKILEKNDYYKKLKVSPGGCADLCVVTLFLEFFS